MHNSDLSFNNGSYIPSKKIRMHRGDQSFDPLSKYRINSSHFPHNLVFLINLMQKLAKNAEEREWISIDTISPKLKIRFHPKSYLKIRTEVNFKQISEVTYVFASLSSDLRRIKMMWDIFTDEQFIALCMDIEKNLKKALKLINFVYIE